MIKICMCDDNEILLSKYSELLRSLAAVHNVDIELRSFTSGEQLLFHLEETPNDVDILYLDILMKGINGVDTASRLRSYGCSGEIIFLTSSEEYVFRSFDVNAFYYIVKDSSMEQRFEDIFLKAVKLSMRKSKEVFLCKHKNVSKQIPLQDISYFEICGRMATVHFEPNEEFTFYVTMETLESKLGKHGFVRCHRSFLLNLRYVDEIHKSDIILQTGKIIPLGISYARDLKIAFSSYLADSFCE